MRDLLLNVLTDIRPEFDFSLSKDFLADGLLDSFDLILLVSNLDKKFAISIEAQEITPENFLNLETLEKLLKKYTEKKQ